MVTVFRQVQILELVQDQDQFYSPVAGNPEREAQHLGDILFVRVPVQRHHLFTLSKAATVEHEMGITQETLDQIGIFGRRGGHTTECRGTVPDQEGGQMTDIHQVHFAHHKLCSADAHVEQGLLNQRFLAGLGRRVDTDMLSVRQKVAQNGTTVLAADKMLPRHITIIYKGTIHG